jgi:hypothetical protein
MDTRAHSSRLVTAVAVTAVSLAAIAATLSSWAARDRMPERPAADAPVTVVKVKAAPAPAVDRLPGVCATCTPGTPGRQL